MALYFCIAETSSGTKGALHWNSTADGKLVISGRNNGEKNKFVGFTPSADGKFVASGKVLTITLKIGDEVDVLFGPNSITVRVIEFKKVEKKVLKTWANLINESTQNTKLTDFAVADALAARDLANERLAFAKSIAEYTKNPQYIFTAAYMLPTEILSEYLMRLTAQAKIDAEATSAAVCAATSMLEQANKELALAQTKQATAHTQLEKLIKASETFGFSSK